MEETEEEKVVPSEDGIQDEESSPSEPQDEEATSEEEATEKEVPFDEHPRWKEVQTAKHEAERAAAEAKAQAEYYKGLAEGSKPVPIPEAPEGSTPEEREFWKKVEDKAKKVADKVRQEERERFETELKTVRNEYGKIAANQFLKDHPDISRGSKELEDIVRKASQSGLPLDDAYRIVMFDKAQETAVEKSKREKQELNKKKLAANVETKTVAKESPVAQRENDFTTEFDRVLQESGEKLN
jgi:hypothetical protein